MRGVPRHPSGADRFHLLVAPQGLPGRPHGHRNDGFVLNELLMCEDRQTVPTLLHHIGELLEPGVPSLLNRPHRTQCWIHFVVDIMERGLAPAARCQWPSRGTKQLGLAQSA